MTSAVLYVLVTLATLLFVHLLVLFILAYKKPRKLSVLQQDYLIVYASQSGHAENLAQQTTQQLQSIGFSVQLCNIAQLQQADLLASTQILWLVSSYGEGDAPDSARTFAHKTLSQDIDLSNKKFAVLALGDRQYTHFCQFGHDLNTWLIQQQATPLFEMICVDQMNVQDLTLWQNQLQQITQSDLVSFQHAKKPWSNLYLLERELLNAGSQGSPLYRISLTVAPDIHWQSGDILEVHCANPTAHIQQFLIAHAQLIDDENIALFRYKDLDQLPQLNRDGGIQDWALHFQDLPYREYSIASVVESGRLDLIVRQEITPFGLGLGSGLLTQYAHIKGEIKARIRTNPAFHLSQTERPLILIGNGSGIAGLLAHLQQCERWQFKQNWLIYGERQQQFDTVCARQIEQWQNDGVLTQVNRVFSRDGHTEKYVQDCLLAQAEQIKLWVEQGAAIYICGSLKGMAQNVDQALLQILGKTLVLELTEQQRYLRDVY